jgi:microcystin degradation protein MlrC
VAERIARPIWNEREDSVYHSAPLTESVTQTAALAQAAGKPVLLIARSDN